MTGQSGKAIPCASTRCLPDPSCRRAATTRVGHGRMKKTEQDEFIELIKANYRSSNGYWAWRDKPIAERGAAHEILQEAGFDVANLVSRPGAEPPDCEATLDRQLSGVEVTELVHQKTLKRNIKAKKEIPAGLEPKRA